jgi:thiamine-phosphate pyrophosphorylase
LLFEYPQPVTLATEHLLLGLAAIPGEVSSWMAERGLFVGELEAELHRLAGHQPGPLPLDFDMPDELAGLSTAPPAVADSASDLFSPAKTPLPSSPVIDPGKQTSHGNTGVTSSAPMNRAPAQTGLWRALDAAANRAGEGLRVVEDYVRFVLDDRHLTAECKQLRHDLTAALARLPARARHAARDVVGDVGTEITTSSEQRRADSRDVAEASCKRAQQALRSLEEFSKAFDPAVARRFERLRYRSYTLERAIDSLATSLVRLATARLYVLIDGQESTGAFAALVETLVAGEVDAIQLRDKTLPDRLLLERARLLSAAVRGAHTLFIMNDRPDLAVLAEAAGVHVGQEELSVKEARSILGPGALVGVSTHSIAQARRAVLDGADYIGVGPTFPSQTKQFSALAGLDLVRAVAQEIRLPAFAIGGIDSDNLPQVIASGMRRVAVSGAVTRAPDTLAAVRSLREQLRLKC